MSALMPAPTSCRASRSDLRGDLRGSAVDKLGGTLCVSCGGEHRSVVSSQHFQPGCNIGRMILAGFQDALQTTFSVFLDIFYPPKFRCFDENGVFEQPRALALIDPMMSVLTMLPTIISSQRNPGRLARILPLLRLESYSFFSNNSLS